jgi:hypothetical protein
MAATVTGYQTATPPATAALDNAAGFRKNKHSPAPAADGPSVKRGEKEAA